METKKSPCADLNKIRGLFFEIGLIGALCLVIGAFAWSQSEKHIEKIDMRLSDAFTDWAPVLIPEDVTPNPVAQTISVIADYINVVDNNSNIRVAFDFDEFNEEHVYLPPQITKKRGRSRQRPVPVRRADAHVPGRRPLQVPQLGNE
ncbi:MAG: hypothetical protein LUD76_09300 [Alistipes sp.]|nr:hypothetical protein [Alistipes sp.]